MAPAGWLRIRPASTYTSPTPAVAPFTATCSPSPSIHLAGHYRRLLPRFRLPVRRRPRLATPQAPSYFSAILQQQYLLGGKAGATWLRTRLRPAASTPELSP